jgi:hypothetical protein
MPRNKLNTATQPIEDTDFDGYGSPAYLKWIEENDEWLQQQTNKDTPANIAALEIMRTLLGGKNEKQNQNKN